MGRPPRSDGRSSDTDAQHETCLPSTGGEQRCLSFCGVATREALLGAEVDAYRAEVDMRAHSDASDAPVWIQTNRGSELPTNTSILCHHPNHGPAVMERARQVGLDEVRSRVAATEVGDDLAEVIARCLGAFEARRRDGRARGWTAAAAGPLAVVAGWARDRRTPAGLRAGPAPARSTRT